MSRVAYVLIRALPGTEGVVQEALRRLDRVTEVHALFGEYDFIARVEVDDTQEITHLILRGIRGIPQVIDTEALIAVGAHGIRWAIPAEDHAEPHLPAPTPWGNGVRPA